MVGEARGRSDIDDEAALARMVLGELCEQVMIGAMAAAKHPWSDATVARMLSTLRGFTRWLYRCGHLASDPLDGDLFRLRPAPSVAPRAPDVEDVERISTSGLPESLPSCASWPPPEHGPKESDTPVSCGITTERIGILWRRDLSVT